MKYLRENPLGADNQQERSESSHSEILRDYTPEVSWADCAHDQDIVRTAWRHADLASRQGATRRVVSTLREERKVTDCRSLSSVGVGDLRVSCS